MSENQPYPLPSQAALNEAIAIELFVVRFLTTCLLSLWISSASSSEEVTARIKAIRTKRTRRLF
jgi:hypothetical protein